MPTISEEEIIKVKIIPDFSRVYPRNYSNYMSISHDEFGFTFTFCENKVELIEGMKDQLKKDADGNLCVSSPVVSQIVVSPLFIPKILEAIRLNYEKFQKKNLLKG